MGSISPKTNLLQCAIVVSWFISCTPAVTVHPDGSIAVAQGGRRSPAEVEYEKTEDGWNFKANTGSNPGKSKEEIREEKRSIILYAGIGSMVLGILIAFWLKYWTPGVCLIGAGVVLIFYHSHPWSSLIISALIGIAAGVPWGFENSERKNKKQTHPVI